MSPHLFSPRIRTATTSAAALLAAFPLAHLSWPAWAAAAAPAPGGGEPTVARGPLRVHPTNPRYFTDDGQRAIYLTGSHTWNSLQDVSGKEWYLPNLLSRQGFEAYLDFLVAHGHNFIRLWIVEHAWNARSDARIAPHPWPRTGPGLALDGRPQFDLSRFDAAYFERLRTRVQAAGARGIYVSVMLFGGMWGTEHTGTWQGHPFHAANNVNGIDGDADGDGLGNEIYTLRLPAVLAVQKATATKVVETLNDLDNVLFEVANEVREYSTDWQYEMLRHLRAVEARLPKRHPLGMTGFDSIPHRALLDSPADWISPSNSGGDYKNNPRAADGRKVILSDTDHLWGEGGPPNWVWKSFTRGLNPIWMDRLRLGPGDLPQADAIRRALGQTRRLADRLDLAALTPQPGLASSGYCLAQTGKCYVVYLPKGGEVTVDLTGAGGQLQAEWIHPVEGKTTPAPAVTGGAQRTLATPFDGPAVLLLQTAPAQGSAERTCPDRAWVAASPESQGMDGAKLRAAVAWLDTQSGADGAQALVIVRNGRLIWQGPKADAIHNIFSCTKVFTSTALGLLTDDGKCRLDDRAAQFWPELARAHSAYADLTLRHLATMSGGYQGVVRDVGSDQPWGEPLGYLTPQSARYPAGTACGYHDHDVFLLGYVLTRLAGAPLQELWQRRIAEPIGLNRWQWGVVGALESGPVLNNFAGTPARRPGVQTSALDLARLGQLYLNEGRWNGRSLLSAAFVAQATTNQVPLSRPHATGADPAGHYGFYWWTNGRQRNGQQPWPAAPARTFAARGAGANACFVVPEWQLVVVRLAATPAESRASDQTWNTFFAKLAEALGLRAAQPSRPQSKPA